MSRSWKTVAVSIALVLPPSLSAQRLTPQFPRANLALSADLLVADSVQTRHIPRTYWLEGGLIGAIGLGVVSALPFQDLCESSNCTSSAMAGGIFGGAVGFTVGALIGGQFRKRS